MGEGTTSRPPSIIAPEAALVGAVKGLSDYGLLARPHWARLLTQFLAQDSRPIPPLLVHRLDAVDPSRAYYYLISFGGTATTVGAVVRVNAISGEYQETMAIPPSERRPWGASAAEWGPRLSSTDPRAIDASQALIWKPCRESASPFYPFKVTTVDGQRRYIRIDGKTFDTLTDLPLAGATRATDTPERGPGQP